MRCERKQILTTQRAKTLPSEVLVAMFHRRRFTEDLQICLGPLKPIPLICQLGILPKEKSAIYRFPVDL